MGGLWSDGTTLWVTKNSSSDRKLFAYDLAGRTRDASEDIDLGADADNLRGLWSDGTTAWVADRDQNDEENKLFAYNLADGTQARAVSDHID